MGGDGKKVFDNACRPGAEGMVSKRVRSKDVSGCGNGYARRSTHCLAFELV
jgi:hypothetical protein